MLTLLVIAGMLAAFVVGVAAGGFVSPVRAADAPDGFDVFWEVWNHVSEDFVDRDRVDFADMTYGAIRGMLATLGDENHTTFFTPEEARQQESSLEGSFEGIGAYVGSEDGVFRIIAPIHGSPAEAAGLLAGDVVLMVDGEVVSGMEEWEIISKIRGPAGSSVTLTVLHPEAEEPVEVEIQRGTINIDSVLWAPIPGTELAYLQISQFAEDTDKELIKALDEINAQSPAFKGVVLDLRNNPGGYLHQAINVASQFLPEDSVVLYERNAKGELDKHVAKSGGRLLDMPMITMINEGTASAGEILAGALQQNGRSRLVGQTTLGTGTVLRPYELSDGSVLRLGVTNWLTPNEELLKDKGVTPDTEVKLDPETPMLDSFDLEQMTADDMKNIADTQFKSALLQLKLQLMQTKSAKQP
jgi:carboxyl-terminal processing protease